MTSVRRVLTDEEMAAVEWRDVPGYPRLQFGSGGEIRVQRRDGTGWVFPTVVQSPAAKYPQVSVWDGEKYASKKVHTLAALAWLGLRPEGQVIRHLDHDRWNWRPDNLAYGSARQNVYDSIEAGRHPSAKLNRSKAAAMRREYEPRYREILRLAEKFGISRSCVQDILTGRSYPDAIPSKAKGYPWRRLGKSA